MSIRISAIVCTHNRAAYLSKAIGSLVKQTLPKNEYEIIVVDNGSTDDTKVIVEGFQETDNLRYIYEPILGLSQARNTGWQKAQGKYIAFIDDDAIACPEWLERIVKAFDTVQPRPGSVGGKVVPIWEGERPAWLPREMELALTIIDWSEKALFLEEDYHFLAGTNVTYRRELLNSFGGFNTQLGRKGTSLLSGEEFLLEKYLKCQNIAIYYDPKIYVYHHVPTDRLTKRWFYRRLFWQGISSEITSYLDTNQRRGKLLYLRQALLSTIGIIRHPSNIFSILIPASSQNQVLRKCVLHSQLGQIWAQMRIGLGLVKT